MSRIALNQPGMGDAYTDAESWFSGGESGPAPPAIEPGAPDGGSSILSTIVSTGTGIVASFSTPDVIKATLNKYLFGIAPTVPAATPTAGQWIPGVPNSYLMLGGAAVLFFAMKKKR